MNKETRAFIWNLMLFVIGMFPIGMAIVMWMYGGLSMPIIVAIASGIFLVWKAVWRIEKSIE